MGKQGHRSDPMVAYEKSLQLALAGHKPLKGPILPNPAHNSLLNPDHFMYMDARPGLQTYQKRSAEQSTTIARAWSEAAMDCSPPPFVPSLPELAPMAKIRSGSNAGNQSLGFCMETEKRLPVCIGNLILR
jgi:hypothetical protein